MRPGLSIVVDYSVIDHLHRIEAGLYQGAHAAPLLQLRAAAETGAIEAWGAEITFVEMFLGIQNVSDQDEAARFAMAKDLAKRAIMRQMLVRRLGYPCSRCDDEYSLIGLTMRCAGTNTDAAIRLEDRLRKIAGVSEGDARQLASCAYPFDGDSLSFDCALHWFVTEDRRLVRAIAAAVSAGTLPELAHLRFGSSADVVAAHQAEFRRFVDLASASKQEATT